MADWSVMDREWPFNQFDPFQYPCMPYYQDDPDAPPCAPPPQPAQPPQLAQPPQPAQPPQLAQAPQPPEPLPPQTLEPLLPPPPPPPPPPAQPFTIPTPALAALLHQEPSASRGLPHPNPPLPAMPALPPRGDNPREIRNKAEKQRRDKLNQSIGELASMVPPVVAASRKIDKTGVLRLTAHYLRAHQYVFGDSMGHGEPQFSAMSAQALLSLFNGFLLTTTYRGLIVVVSQNVQQYLGYTELDLLGQSIFNIIHDDDHQLMRDQLMPKKHMLGPHGELLVPDEPEGTRLVAEALANEKRRFIVRFKKLCQRSEPCQYVTCHIEGSLRKSDRACRGYNRCCQMVRRARARGDNPCSSGNDVVFVGMVRLATETFITESNMESHRMEYRTRHSIDGQILQSEQRISLVTGYMTHEVNGINAMNFMHRDDVRWVVIALREMYDQHRLVGESCYRLMTRNGQFIYLKTRGQLEVDASTRAVTSFVCTNTVVDEQEGKHLIKMMKKKFMLMVNNNEEPPPEEENKDVGDQNLAVEDPRQLEKVILHLVTNLPSPQSEEDIRGDSPDGSGPSAGRLSIIPPKKERIVSAIEKIYSVIKTFPPDPDISPAHKEKKSDTQVMTYRKPSANFSPQLNNDPPQKPKYTQPADNALPKLPTFNDIYQRRGAEATIIMHGRNTMNPATVLRGNTMSAANNYLGMAAITMGSVMNASVGSTSDQGNKIQYRLFITPSSTANKSKGIGEQKVVLPGPEPILITSGTKRPREYADLDTVSKKKNADVKTPENADNADNSPYLEKLLDEALTTYPQIETAMNSLEQTMDPSFPDLLVSSEVEEILQKIEEDQGNSNPDI